MTKDQTVLQEILYSKTSRINSFHHQSIKDLADGLIIAGSEVIAIEAVQSTDESRFLGVQWHPELRLTEPSRSQALCRDSIIRGPAP